MLKNYFEKLFKAKTDTLIHTVYLYNYGVIGYLERFILIVFLVFMDKKASQINHGETQIWISKALARNETNR